MIELGERFVDISQTVLTRLQTEIDVIERNSKIGLIQAAIINMIFIIYLKDRLQ